MRLFPYVRRVTLAKLLTRDEQRQMNARPSQSSIRVCQTYPDPKILIEQAFQTEIAQTPIEETAGSTRTKFSAAVNLKAAL